jgi:hypothetical protein
MANGRIRQTLSESAGKRNYFTRKSARFGDWLGRKSVALQDVIRYVVMQ